mmetsp:Transcript_48337/g.156263  ORF Transcript_48337/g.156263 Transcript_48337/m.156263 type:complete len:293 (+) Transcript_48337:114-992(+)
MPSDSHAVPRFPDSGPRRLLRHQSTPLRAATHSERASDAAPSQTPQRAALRPSQPQLLVAPMWRGSGGPGRASGEAAGSGRVLLAVVPTGGAGKVSSCKAATPKASAAAASIGRSRRAISPSRRPRRFCSARREAPRRRPSPSLRWRAASSSSSCGWPRNRSPTQPTQRPHERCGQSSASARRRGSVSSACAKRTSAAPAAARSRPIARCCSWARSRSAKSHFSANVTDGLISHPTHPMSHSPQAPVAPPASRKARRSDSASRKRQAHTSSTAMANTPKMRCASHTPCDHSP